MATSTLGNGTLVLAGTTSGTTTVTATAVAGTTTLTLPAATDTLVGKATTDTLTNKTLTGAAMNGTLGATTPSTASVTTLTTSSTITHNGGTANGVAYLDGSKVLTTGSALVFDGSNLGVGVTPSASTLAQFEGGSNFILTGRGNVYIGNNVTFNSSFKYIATAAAAQYNISGAEHRWLNAASGTAGNAISFTQAMTLDSSGNLLVGTTSGSWHNLIKSSSGGYALNVFNTNASSGDGGMQLRAGTNNTASIVLNAGYQGPSATDTFRIYGNGTYGTISDATRKKNIESARDGYLQDLQQLRVVKYNWLTQEDEEAKELGFIAQEVEQVFAGLIETDSKGLKMIKQPVLIPMLVKAIQELKAEFDAYKASHP